MPKPPAPQVKPIIRVTDLSDMTVCEQRILFDRRYGKRRTRYQRGLQREGIHQHRLHENTLRAAGMDRRCFIATAVFGPEAPQTMALRAWRDRALIPSRPGRILVRAYYHLSPSLARRLKRDGRASRLIAAVLFWFIKKVVAR